MKILIVGAGISGLYKAYTLVNKGHKIDILEKKNYIGGQLKTLKYQVANDKYFFDIGPHISPRNHPIWNWMCNNVDSISTPLPIKVSLFLKKDLDLVFPPDFRSLMKTKFSSLLSLIKFLPSYLISTFIKKKERNLADSLINSWGSRFYWSYISNFISTFWKDDPRNITSEYKARFSPPSILFIIKKTIQGYGASSKLNPTKKPYPYPKFGTGEVVSFIESELLKKDVKIIRTSKIVGLKRNTNNFNVKYEINDKLGEESYDQIYWTGSISDLAEILNLNEYKDLDYRRLLIINLKINKKSLLQPDVHTSYIMIPHIIFHRIYEPKKISPFMAPTNTTSACLEVILKNTAYNEKTITQKALDQFKSLYNLDDDELEHLGNFFYEEGYSLLSVNYKERYNQFIQEVKKYNPNFYFIGRTGQFFPYNLTQTLDSVDDIY